jgi:hypothetical protein
MKPRPDEPEKGFTAAGQADLRAPPWHEDC